MTWDLPETWRLGLETCLWPARVTYSNPCCRRCFPNAFRISRRPPERPSDSRRWIEPMHHWTFVTSGGVPLFRREHWVPTNFYHRYDICVEFFFFFKGICQSSTLVWLTARPRGDKQPSSLADEEAVREQQQRQQKKKMHPNFPSLLKPNGKTGQTFEADANTSHVFC